MTIETKFKPGDTVFFMHENKVAESKVILITVTARSPGAGRPLSITVTVEKPFNTAMVVNGDEDLFFTSKEELLASL